jgi:plastocyanin
MTHPRFRQIMFAVAALAAGFAWQGLAMAATVKGTVSLPSELKIGRRFLGHWRVENTNVAMQHSDLRGGTVVVLVGPQFQSVPPKSASVEIFGLQATPAALVISSGTVVEFKNSDKVSHDLSTPDHPDVMAPERLSSGSVRKQRFATAGEYLVHCTEFPHIVVSVIVTNSSLHSVVEDKGGFKISDVPEGHATLKVWSNGAWVHEQEIDVPARGLDLTVKVQGSSSAKETAE